MINIINKLMIKIIRSVCQRNLNAELNGVLLDRLIWLLLVFDPNGVPQVMQTNRPASERSALNMEPPQELQYLELINSYNRVNNNGYQRKNRNTSKRDFITEGENKWHGHNIQQETYIRRVRLTTMWVY